MSSITLAEVLFGIEAMPAGRRRNTLAETFAGICAIFDQRILVFDAEAAPRYAGLAVKARTGKGFPVPDGYIAAIAAAKGFQVASRDAAPFRTAGVSVIDPWEYAAQASHFGTVFQASFLQRDPCRLIPVPVAFQIGL